MTTPLNLNLLAANIKQWGHSLGFQQVGICDTDLSVEEPKLQEWLDKQYHGEMAWMKRHGMMRARPNELLPGTLRVISVRMNYLPAKASFASTLNDAELGYISRYALGRDYHKLLRQRLKKLGEQIQNYCHDFEYQGVLNFRPFVDSAPVMERPLAAKAGLGWVGKHSLILNREAGSWFFLGELLINLPLPIDPPQEEQCGRCVACMTTCPTGAIIAPYTIDARRCISYLTIELDGIIPEEFRPLMGNRIYGCDDCQIICPWNRFSQLTDEDDFSPRVTLHTPKLLDLFNWSEEKFLRITEGSAIRRIGYLRWLRNIIVALGNAPYQYDIILTLQQRLGLNTMLDEHIHWAIEQQIIRRKTNTVSVQTAQQKRLIRAITKGLPRDA
ncbi:tRNA epoxyqueuosine(34) reductase QueG [Photorhabdus laumondii subsp. laumondii]|uniref:Epoxyqueuosine reductase n=1 Tax=Photorhabdus laumondii subsp. laumondii TaxID=141679 RepID=A0A6L9JS44_PHOLM|nr:MULTISPECIES: tRNA epoxyqueuosine(34) reductase QueG [Photorhabdus]AWK44630.1 tRNA epoxyqueuosine(34) reductase QueG [Photorhabdus laumondii subsp. laumondii]AXG45343.1 tRNA epoxyqueuosine(34) reductase QueG [Photorhabdus laumondii subsp. laumondii]MCC8382660.1 tRNA epoxyqueuosine(34) reductase QueG [Photorhabdus laumondii]MCC8387031.1 tRNA epoxyqueuosine(34) reductase QueG [Photorhabdus laumondii]MCC8412464.1 tRNA epoxyqueuosine(34) reductase QueG [Photorhabdus laumondii]